MSRRNYGHRQAKKRLTKDIEASHAAREFTKVNKTDKKEAPVAEKSASKQAIAQAPPATTETGAMATQVDEVTAADIDALFNTPVE